MKRALERMKALEMVSWEPWREESDKSSRENSFMNECKNKKNRKIFIGKSLRLGRVQNLNFKGIRNLKNHS